MSRGGAVDIGGGIIAHVGAQDAPPVLWIHGYSLDARAWRERGRCLHGVAAHRYRFAGRLDLPRPRVHLHTRRPRPGHRKVRGAPRHKKARRVVVRRDGGAVGRDRVSEPVHVAACSDARRSEVDRTTATRRRAISSWRACSPTRGRGPWMTDLWMTSPPDIFTGAAKQPALWTRLREIVNGHSWSELADDECRR